MLAISGIMLPSDKRGMIRWVTSARTPIIPFRFRLYYTTERPSRQVWLLNSAPDSSGKSRIFAPLSMADSRWGPCKSVLQQPPGGRPDRHRSHRGVCARGRDQRRRGPPPEQHAVAVCRKRARSTECAGARWIVWEGREGLQFRRSSLQMLFISAALTSDFIALFSVGMPASARAATG